MFITDPRLAKAVNFDEKISAIDVQITKLKDSDDGNAAKQIEALEQLKKKMLDDPLSLLNGVNWPKVEEEDKYFLFIVNKKLRLGSIDSKGKIQDEEVDDFDFAQIQGGKTESFNDYSDKLKEQIDVSDVLNELVINANSGLREVQAENKTFLKPDTVLTVPDTSSLNDAELKIFLKKRSKSIKTGENDFFILKTKENYYFVYKEGDKVTVSNALKKRDVSRSYVSLRAEIAKVCPGKQQYGIQDYQETFNLSIERAEKRKGVIKQDNDRILASGMNRAMYMKLRKKFTKDPNVQEDFDVKDIPKNSYFAYYSEMGGKGYYSIAYVDGERNIQLIALFEAKDVESGKVPLEGCIQKYNNEHSSNRLTLLKELSSYVKSYKS